MVEKGIFKNTSSKDQPERKTWQLLKFRTLETGELETGQAGRKLTADQQAGADKASGKVILRVQVSKRLRTGKTLHLGRGGHTQEGA